jgi:hypothetical protein
MMETVAVMIETAAMTETVTAAMMAETAVE